MNNINDISLRKAAIVSGVAIMIMTVAAVTATDLTIGSLIVKDNAVATANRHIIVNPIYSCLEIFDLLMKPLIMAIEIIIPSNLETLEPTDEKFIANERV